MADAVREGRAPVITGEDALHSLAVVQAIYESERTGRPVDVAEILATRALSRRRGTLEEQPMPIPVYDFRKDVANVVVCPRFGPASRGWSPARRATCTATTSPARSSSCWKGSASSSSRTPPTTSPAAPAS